ncbi:kinase-regulated stress-responsive transcription factor skn7 [Orbilia blumenaviensis]|uniref:Kinase-regulated stress-responsive transcription factor skn7 n=1 Tax=Orbilia blumenaviensis TaxID=1796055 RepID=A0AAV9UUA4_9PEZI
MEGDSSKGGSNATLNTGNTSDFVKKLYRMLSEKQHSHVVRWSDSGGSFIVFDNSEFTKNVLPQHFKHSNFASFVRQLNKYDFHKVRATDESLAQNGDQAWEFVHPHFRFGNDGNLEGIKRKAPTQRNKKDSEEPPKEDETREVIAKLQARLDRVCAEVSTLQELYHKALSQMRFVNNSAYIPHPHHPEHEMPMHVSPQLIAHQMSPHGPPQIHPATPLQADRFMQPQHSPVPPPPHHPNGYVDVNGNGMNNVNSQAINLSGFGNTAAQSGVPLHATDPQISTTFRQEPRRPLGTRKKSAGAVVPHWKRPPKILLVEDDPTCRKIGLKFLEQVGCLPFYACDGLEGIRKFQDPASPPYDLVLMDIVMPHLDGASACGEIRKERPDMKDPPVIAMTSNIRTTDINLYFNSGMIDVLPKPFTRDGLLQTLQKWLPHLQAGPNEPSSKPAAFQPPGSAKVSNFPNTVTIPNTTTNNSPQSIPITAQQPQPPPSTSPVLKIEFNDNTTNSHAEDEDDEDDDVHGRGGQDTPDSSVGGMVASSTMSGGVSHPHPPHPQQHPHHGHHPSGDYTFAETNGPPVGYGGPPGASGVEGEMLNASAGIYTPGLVGLGAPQPGAGVASPRGGIRRPLDAGIHDEYDPRMKRMRYNAA